MAWQSPRTWASGEFWTAALVNEQLRDNMIALTPVIGELKMFVRQPTASETVIGTNWLECNGVAVSRANYSALFGLLAGMRSVRSYVGTTLTAAMDTAQTTLTITRYDDSWPGGRQYPWTAAYPFTPFLLQVDSEIVLVTDRGAYPYLTLTVVRGREGTLAAAHNLGASIYPTWDLPFGSGDGVTTFNLPDLHGRTLVSAARAGGHIDVTTVGRDDGAVLAARRPKHRHSWETNTSGAVGNQVNWASGTLGAGIVNWTSNDGGWPYQTYGQFIGPRDEGGPGVGRAINTTPLDAPGHVVAGVWGIRFVGV